MMAVVRDISEILNMSYGDVGTGPIDRVAANEIVNYLREHGWINSEELALLVDAAGGEIRVKANQMLDDPPPLLMYRDIGTDDLVLQTKPQTVQSGPINVKPTKDSEDDHSNG